MKYLLFNPNYTVKPDKWKEILKELCECGFSPYISAKMPL